MTRGKLVACCPILFKTRQYEAGDVLPVADVDDETLDAWRKAGSVALIHADEGEKGGRHPSAKLVTALAGMPGITANGEQDPLVGRVPERHERTTGRGAKR